MKDLYKNGTIEYLNFNYDKGCGFVGAHIFNKDTFYFKVDTGACYTVVPYNAISEHIKNGAAVTLCNGRVIRGVGYGGEEFPLVPARINGIFIGDCCLRYFNLLVQFGREYYSKFDGFSFDSAETINIDSIANEPDYGLLGFDFLIGSTIIIDDCGDGHITNISVSRYNKEFEERYGDNIINLTSVDDGDYTKPEYVQHSSALSRLGRR